MYKFLVGILSAIIISQYFLTFIDYNHNQYYALSRFKMHAKLSIEDTWTNVGIEREIYNYKEYQNKIYVYGSTGITIINLNPIVPHIIKIPNLNYYNSLNDNDYTSIYDQSLESLKLIYGDNLEILNSIDDLTASDKKVVELLFKVIRN